MSLINIIHDHSRLEIDDSFVELYFPSLCFSNLDFLRQVVIYLTEYFFLFRVVVDNWDFTDVLR